MLAGNIREIPREGTLLPETYKFTRGTTREQMIQRMQQAQTRVLQEVWERRSADLPVKSPEQLVTLASIVEKETGKPDERTRVAAVFVNRLKQKMKLQSDPTIIYGLVGGKGTLGRPIMRSEIEQPTPYNTYVIDGCRRGRSPIRAAPRSKRPPIRRAPRNCSSSPTAPAATPSPRTYDQHQQNVARLRSSSSSCARPTRRRPTARRPLDAAGAAPAPSGAGRQRPAPRRASTPSATPSRRAVIAATGARRSKRR